MKSIFVFAALVLLILACGNNESTSDAQKIPVDTTVRIVNNPSFNASFKEVLSSYYGLKDALVAADTIKANLFAGQMQEKTDSLNKEMQLDSSRNGNKTAALYAATIVGSAKGLIGENGLENKRKEFQMISDALYDFIQTVGYKEETIYHQYCPMAFDDAGAYWLSNSNEVVNPYFGDKMLHCGEVKDSISGQ